MRSLTAQRCFNHSHRDAAARCTGCHQYFWDHEGRVVCTACLLKTVSEKTKRPSKLGGLFKIVQFCLACLVIWFFFYFLGVGLLSIPSSFHEGTIWQHATEAE